MAIFQRTVDPPTYAHYSAYKQLLRTDFKHRCAYCLLHEGDELGAGFHNFQIDHFRPQSNSLFEHLANEYTNLYYACRWCNRAKAETWPSDSEQQAGYVFVDPCQDDLFRDHCRLEVNSGKILPTSKAGDYTIREIRLNREMFRKLRVSRVAAQAQIERTRHHIRLLQAEENPKVEIISDLEEKITLLIEKFINPKIPYEPDDLLVAE